MGEREIKRGQGYDNEAIYAALLAQEDKALQAEIKRQQEEEKQQQQQGDNR